MLIFPLKNVWYDKIKNGEKSIEYRELKPYWTSRLKKDTRNESLTDFQFIDSLFDNKININTICLLRKAYTNIYMKANINKIEIVEGTDTDLKLNDFIYAIHLTKVEDYEKESKETIIN